MQKAYTQLARYYDLFFQQKEYKKETVFLKELIATHHVSTDTILDIGCGTGEHLRLLYDTFSDLYGIDSNVEILEQARKKVPDGHFYTLPMQNFALHKKFNVIICLYSVFNYNLTIEDAEATLKNFYTHLDDEGIVVIALYNHRSRKKKVSLHMGEDATTKVVKINQYVYDPDQKIVNADYVVFIKERGKVDFDIELGETMRIFEKEEITTMVKKIGFEHSSLYDGFAFEPVKASSTYPVLVLQK